MKRIGLGAALATLLALLGSADAASAAGPGFSFDVKIAPVEGAAGQYLCEATATDLATGNVVFAPRLKVLAGKSNVASSGDPGGKRDFLLSVSIEGEGKEARYTLEIHEGETLVASQKAAVKLR